MLPPHIHGGRATGRGEPGVARARPLPAWVDGDAYPFAPRAFATPEGDLSYVDEGTGAPVVLVHGTPTWSFLWRDLIGRLARAGYRAIAPDHLGFGLSRGRTSADYTPQAHAVRLARLLDALAAGDPTFRDVTLVVHDFGGPVGLSYALTRPDVVTRLVICNSWCWPLDADRKVARGARLAGSPLGRVLYRRFDLEMRVVFPSVFADRARLTPALARQYAGPFPDAESRVPQWEVARALLGASRWYAELWARLGALRDTPTLLAWGTRDPFFGPAYLARWREALPHAAVAELPEAGHFVQEEAPDALADATLHFLDQARAW